MRVFSIVNKVVAPRSILVGTRTLSTGYKVLQGTNPLYKGSKGLQGANPLCKGSRHYSWDLVASMTSYGATTSPCWHQWQFHQQYPLLSLMTTTHVPPVSMLSFCLHVSLCCHLSPLESMAKGDHISSYETTDHWSLLPLSTCTILGPVCIPGVTISFEFILQPHEIKVC